MAAFDNIPRSIRQLLGGIDGSVLDTYGGEYEFDKFNITLHSARGVMRDFSIRYGVNMLDFTDDTDYQGVYTSCVPYWKGADSTGAEVVVFGQRVDSGVASYNGRNICAALDLSDKFEEPPTTAQLESMAQTYMNSNQTYMPHQSIKVDFVRLQDMGYEGLDNLLQCNLCDTLTVEFPDYSMHGQFKIVKTVWDALEERYTAMELGTLSVSLADALGISNSLGSGGGESSDDLNVRGDLNVGGDTSIAGALTVGGAEVKPTVYRDFNSQSFTTTTGAVGSYMMLMDVNVALNGYVPVSVTLCGWAHVSYIPMFIIQNSTTVRIILLRNGSGAATYQAGDFKFRVHYLKS